MGTVATEVITITSITFPLLLLALQQSAVSLSHQVFDHFLLLIGSYTAHCDTVAVVRTGVQEDADRVSSAVQKAIHFHRVRRLDSDPTYGIEQLETIAWRSISTSQQNPSPGKIAIHSLRDLLARWAGVEETATDEEILPVVYPDDVMTRLLGAFESLVVVVASESMQHQTCAEILRTFAVTFDHLPLRERFRVEDLVLRTLSGLGDHLLTTELDEMLTDLVSSLERAGQTAATAAVRRAQTDLASSICTLTSRATRVPGAG